MVYNNILEAVGNTPMVELQRMPEPGSARILVKVEGLNVGGSIKTRTALNMIVQAEKQGIIGPDTIIVEPTSGNQGIGLALVGAVRGYRTIIIMPDSVSEERAKLVRHYGAEVRLIHDAGDIGACIDECLQTALRMQKKDPRVFVPQQFSNPNNTMAQKDFTAQEILDQVGGPIHGFCSGIGTGGTLTGIGEVLREHNPEIEIWAVEPENAAILAGGTIGTHMQATASSRIFSTARSMTRSASRRILKRSRLPSAWPGRRDSWSGSLPEQTWRPRSNWRKSSAPAKQS